MSSLFTHYNRRDVRDRAAHRVGVFTRVGDDQRGYVLGFYAGPDGALGRRLDLVAGNMLCAARRRCVRIEPRF